MEQRSETWNSENSLIRHLERYPEDFLDIRRLQRKYGMPMESVALVLADLVPRD